MRSISRQQRGQSLVEMAMSLAQVYFQRPRSLIPRLFGHRREMGSLFSPYWQARRVDTPCSTRQLVAAKHATVAPCL
jgi:hypothetical protein